MLSGYHTSCSRCREAVEDGRVQLRELQRRLQKQRADQEELVERNEELEALVGETQNASKEERQRHDGELEGLRRKVRQGANSGITLGGGNMVTVESCSLIGH